MYLQVFRHSIVSTLAYRFGVFIRVAAMSVFLTVLYFLFKAYYAGLTPGTAPITFPTMISYLGLAQFVSVAHWSWLIMQTGERVRNGKIAMELLRPYDYQLYNLAVNAGGAVSNLVVSGLPLFLLYLLVFKTGSSFTPLTLVCFALSIALSFLIRFAWNYIIATLTFYVENSWGLSVASSYLIALFSGQLIPLPLVPEPFHAILRHTPFASMIDTPVSIGSGIIPSSGVLPALGLQLAWAVVLGLLGRAVFARASRAITLHGG